MGHVGIESHARISCKWWIHRKRCLCSKERERGIGGNISFLLLITLGIRKGIIAFPKLLFLFFFYFWDYIIILLYCIYYIIMCFYFIYFKIYKCIIILYIYIIIPLHPSLSSFQILPYALLLLSSKFMAFFPLIFVKWNIYAHIYIWIYSK